MPKPSDLSVLVVDDEQDVLTYLSAILEEAGFHVRTATNGKEALAAVKRTTLFTTHTPVPAGNETFDRKLVRRYLEPWVRDVGCEPEEALDLGRDNGNFNMTAFSIRLAASTNGVSRLHGEVSRRMLGRYTPHIPAVEIPVGHVTNGAHMRSCVSRVMAGLFDRYLGPEWWRNPGDASTVGAAKAFIAARVCGINVPITAPLRAVAAPTPTSKAIAKLPSHEICGESFASNEALRTSGITKNKIWFGSADARGRNNFGINT